MKVVNCIFDDKRDSSKFYVDDWGPSMTKQSFTKDADVNNILAKYIDANVPLSALPSQIPQYGDFSLTRDGFTALNIARDLRAEYDRLPIDIRKRFDTPNKLLEFMLDPSHGEELVSLGLAERPQGWKAPEEPPKPEASGGKGAEAPKAA